MCGARRNGCGGETDVVCGRAPAKAASGRDDPACRPPAAQEQKEAGAAEEDEEGGQRQGGGGGRGKSELDLRWCTPGGGPVGPAETPGGSGKEARGRVQPVGAKPMTPNESAAHGTQPTAAAPGAACGTGRSAARGAHSMMQTVGATDGTDMPAYGIEKSAAHGAPTHVRSPLRNQRAQAYGIGKLAATAPQLRKREREGGRGAGGKERERAHKRRWTQNGEDEEECASPKKTIGSLGDLEQEGDEQRKEHQKCDALRTLVRLPVWGHIRLAALGGALPLLAQLQLAREDLRSTLPKFKRAHEVWCQVQRRS
ncbi:unnamed protein product [Prorocentrum cordatum]|uniref:Uncharacterized protein n=1 Tax=Prorocentrum cordatum TaxID=2364126 RepID=A0ABN9T116_9DINO|nr:unnamed protein product [Polarella glacialis]